MWTTSGMLWTRLPRSPSRKARRRVRNRPRRSPIHARAKTTRQWALKRAKNVPNAGAVRDMRIYNEMWALHPGRLFYMGGKISRHYRCKAKGPRVTRGKSAEPGKPRRARRAEKQAQSCMEIRRPYMEAAIRAICGGYNALPGKRKTLRNNRRKRMRRTSQPRTRAPFCPSSMN